MAAVMEKETFDVRLLSPISTAELERRWALARGFMKELGLDAVVAQSNNAQSGCGYFRWFTDIANGGSNPQTVIFPADGLMTVINQGKMGGERKLDGKSAPNRGIGKRMFTPSYPSLQYTGTYDSELAAKELRNLGAKRVGFACPATMYHTFGKDLEQRLAAAGVEVVDCTDAMDKVKCVKSAEELEIVRRTCAMQDEVMRRVAQYIKPGMKDFEVYAYAQYQGQLLGSENGIFLGSSATPPEPAAYRPRSMMGREIKKGDTFILLVENSGPSGYYAEIARPFVLGKATQEMKDLVSLINEAQANTVRHLKPGAYFPDIIKAHNDFMTKHGKHPEERIHCHGQGYDLVERPLCRQDESGMRVMANMYMACHPEVNTPKEFMTICDNFLIHADGTQERLHKLAQEYIEIN
jgi:Xaa-Pro aminopeptidase